MRRFVSALLVFLTLTGPLAAAARCGNCCFGNWGIFESATRSAPAKRNCCGARRGADGAAARDHETTPRPSNPQQSSRQQSSRPQHNATPSGDPVGDACDCSAGDPSTPGSKGISPSAQGSLDALPAAPWSGETARAARLAAAPIRIPAGAHAPTGFVTLRC